MFKYKKGIRLPYNRQGYIYFMSMSYPLLSDEDKEKIHSLCQESAGQHWRALLEFVTTEANATYIETHFFISKAQLYRYVAKYNYKFKEKYPPRI